MRGSQLPPPYPSPEAAFPATKSRQQLALEELQKGARSPWAQSRIALDGVLGLTVCILFTIAPFAMLPIAFLGILHPSERNPISERVAMLAGMVFMAIAPIIMWGLRRSHIAARRALTGCCTKGGYNLMRSPDRCPECGAENPFKRVE